MKTAKFPALFICIILVAVCGITNAGEKKLLNVEVPLPDDITIGAPAKDVPKDIAAFSGVWEGKWAYTGANAALVVEEINSKDPKTLRLYEKNICYVMSCEDFLFFGFN